MEHLERVVVLEGQLTLPFGAVDDEQDAPAELEEEGDSE